MEEESISHLNSHLARHLELVEGQTCDPIKLRENSGLIREGYKKTKLGWIPKDWEVVKFNKIASFNPKSESLPESFIYIDLESVKDGILQKRTILKKDDAPSRAQRVLKKNDVLFQTVRPYQKNNLFFQEEGDFVASTGYAQIRAKYNSRFIFHLIQVTYFNNQVLARCTGTSFPAISAKDLSNVLIKLPTLPEQQKIATILSTWDSAIAKQEQLIIAKQEFKKGLMQLLLTGKKRFEGFEGEWAKSKLGDHCSVLMCKRIFNNETSDTGEIPFYKIGTIGKEPNAFISRRLFEEYKEKYNYPNLGEVLITCSGTVGKCLSFNGEDAYFQDSNIVWLDNPENELDNKFLFYLISIYDWDKLNSTTITRIYTSDLKSMKIVFPKIDEQKQIASVLSAADKEIGLLQSELTSLRGQKRGLMQVLLTGKKRVQL